MTEEQKKPDDTPNEALVQATLTHVEAQLTYALDDEQRGAVRKTVERHLKMMAKLQAVPLKNADEPDFVFRPYRAEG